MFAALATLCFLLALFHAAVPVDLVVLGFAFIGLALLFGNWPIGAIMARRQ